MKHFTLVPLRSGVALFRLLPVLLVLMFSACSKEGDPGPKGDNGKDGNADVTVFNYGAQTITGGALNLTLNITQGRVDSSMILIYYNPEVELATAWYPMPGLGSGGLYDTRYLVYPAATAGQYVVAIRLNGHNGAAYIQQVKFRKLRIFVVPAGKIVNARQTAPVDFKDYHAVVKYYGIAD